MNSYPMPRDPAQRREALRAFVRAEVGGSAIAAYVRQLNAVPYFLAVVAEPRSAGDLTTLSAEKKVE